MSIQKYASEEHDLNRGSKFLEQVPNEILELILQRLNILDYLAFCQVCAPLRALGKRCPPAPQLPWLLLNSHPYYIEDQCFRSFLGDLSARNTDPQKLFYESICLGSVEGWMIMSTRVHENSPDVHLLLNPITGSRIVLPPQSTIADNESTGLFYLQKAVASLDRTITRLENCLVACLSNDDRLVFCRPIDESWTVVEAKEGSRFTEAEIIDGKIYAVRSAYGNSLIVFNIQGVSYTVERLVELPSLPYVRFEIHLAKDASKDLFIVYRIESRDMIGIKAGTNLSFEVFKLECNKNDDSHCVQVYDLGDQALFVSELGNRVISASSDLCGSNNNRLENNCIYYALRWVRYSARGKFRIEFGVFSLANKTQESIKLLTLPGYVSPNPLKRFVSIVWFTPNPW